MFIGKTAKEILLGLGSAEGGQTFGTRLLLMVIGPLMGLAYIILIPLIGVVMVILLGTYKIGKALRALLKR